MTDTHESCLGPEIPRPELGCSDCYFGGRKRVGSRGDPTSRFVIIGESPGIMEIADGVPFIGPSGHLLEQVLDQVGINISERPYILNAIKCYPRGLKSAETLSVAAARCHMHLMEELSAYPRDVILTLGNAALWTITGDYGTKITRVRGQVFKSSHARVGVVASVHPAFLLYGGGNLKQFRGDIALALKLLREGLPLRMEDIRYGILDKPYQIRQLAKLLHRLDATDLITADIETEGFSYLLDGMVSTGIQFKDYAYIFRAELSIPELWTSPARYNWHNGKFDTKFHHQRGEPARCDEDTMLMSYCLSPSTRILTRDLTWETAGNISVGDELVGFNEWNEKRTRPGQTMVPTIVTAINKQTAPCYKITSEHGSVVCSENHMWAAHKHNQSNKKWLRTGDMFKSKGKQALSLFVVPWGTLPDSTIGYISGILDGEGCLSVVYPKGPNSTGKSANWKIQIAQKPGLVLDKVRTILQDAGFNFGEYDTNVVHHITFHSARETLRVLGTFRPIRLMSKSDHVWVGDRKHTQSKILAIEYVGDQEVIGIETTTHTLIAEGFLSHNCLNERRGIHDLDQLGIDHLKMDPHKGMLAPWEPPKYVRKSVQSIAPFEVVAKYQAIDIAKTHKLASVLLPQVDADPNASKLYHNLLMPASNFLTKVEKRGICVDVFWTQKNNAYLEANCNQYEAEVNKIASDAMGHEINVRSWQQLKKLLYGTLALGPMSKRTDEDTLREILRTLPNDSIGHHVITNQLLYRGAHKQWRTYTYRLIFDVLDKKQRVVKLRYMGPDGRVHATFLIHGTATGRLSSREPNNQNQPRDPMIRGQYVAAPGRVFIEPDLSQAELRSLACLSHDPILLAIFNSTDRSLHDEVATKLFGTGFSGEEKMIAKNVNFGIVYGITAVGLYLQLVAEGVDGYTVSDCQAWLDGWGEQFPTAWGFISKCRDAVLNQQTIITLFGRKKRHGVIAAERLKSLQDEASNMPHQSIASDIVLKSSINVDPIIEEQYNADIVNLVHDSNLTEVNDDEEKARSTAIAIMDEFTSLPARMGLTACPFVSDCKIGKRWGEAKNVRRKDIVMRSGKILRAHPEWVQNATDFMRGWNPKKDAYPIWNTPKVEMAA